jgi:CHAT domain-containing protein
VDVTQNTEVLDVLPTPSRIAELMPDTEHFFYSGHGTRKGGQSGLVLVDEDGRRSLLSEDEVLSMRALHHRPVVVLSACDTASGEQGSSELFDLASCFLRIGAKFVIGSLWVVVEDCATAFTANLYGALRDGTQPNWAFGLALRELRRHRSARTTTSKVPLDHPIYWAAFLALRGE